MAEQVTRAPAETRKADPFNILQWALLLVSLPFGILNFLLPVYGKQVGANAVEIGLLFSVFSLMTVVLRPLVGFGLDYLGRRSFLVAGLAAYGLAMLAFAYSAAVWGLVAARVLQGIASGLLWLTVNAMVADLASPDVRARSFGAVTQASNQGGMIGTFIGFSVLLFLGIDAGWKQLFFGYAAAGLLAAVIAWRRMPETRGKAQVEERTDPLAGLRAVRRSRPLLVLMLTGLITTASSAMLAPIFLIYLQEKFQADISTLAWAFFPSALVWTFLPSRMGALSDRIGRRPLMALALAVAAVDSLLVPVLGSLPALAALWVIEAVCFSASDPAGQALITDLTGEKQRGRVYGAYALVSGLGAVIGPLAGGWLYETYSQTAPFLVNGLALAASAAVLWLGLRGQR